MSVTGDEKHFNAFIMKNIRNSGCFKYFLHLIFLMGVYSSKESCSWAFLKGRYISTWNKCLSNTFIFVRNTFSTWTPFIWISLNFFSHFSLAVGEMRGNSLCRVRKTRNTILRQPSMITPQRNRKDERSEWQITCALEFHHPQARSGWKGMEIMPQKQKSWYLPKFHKKNYTGNKVRGGKHCIFGFIQKEKKMVIIFKAWPTCISSGKYLNEELSGAATSAELSYTSLTLLLPNGTSLFHCSLPSHHALYLPQLLS